MNFPSQWHPAKSIHAMRFCCAIEEDQDGLVRFAGAAFASYFDRQENLDDPEVLEAVANAAGLDGAAIRAAAADDAVKARDRKSGVEGKRVSVRVALGGRRRLNKNKQPNTEKSRTATRTTNTN